MGAICFPRLNMYDVDLVWWASCERFWILFSGGRRSGCCAVDVIERPGGVWR